MPVNSCSAAYQQHEEPLVISQSPASAGGKLASALPVRETEQPRLGFPPYRPEQSAILPVEEAAPVAPTVADVSLNLAAARQAAYPEPGPQGSRRSPALVIQLICLIVFPLLFSIG